MSKLTPNDLIAEAKRRVEVYRTGSASPTPAPPAEEGDVIEIARERVAAHQIAALARAVEEFEVVQDAFIGEACRQLGVRPPDKRYYLEARRRLEQYRLEAIAGWRLDESVVEPRRTKRKTK